MFLSQHLCFVTGDHKFRDKGSTNLRGEMQIFCKEMGNTSKPAFLLRLIPKQHAVENIKTVH